MLKLIRKIVILVVGLTVLLIGVVMIVLPGPAIVVIPVGLLILGTEFVWASRIIKKFKQRANQLEAQLFKQAPIPNDAPDNQKDCSSAGISS
ncbi:MAG: PGPGW domain-containing protein [bacterium]